MGGLLGDTLFHLLPEIFLGEDEAERARFVLVEPNRNLVLGLAILVGFMTFVAMDKGLRIATGGAGHDHSHGHAEKESGLDKAVVSGADVGNGEVKSRKKGKKGKDAKDEEKKEINPSVKLGGYLNLMFVLSLLQAPSVSFTQKKRLQSKSQVTNVFFQRRLHAQHHRRPRHVSQFLRLPHHRRNHHCRRLLPRNPPRSRRLRATNPVGLFQARRHGVAIHHCHRRPHGHIDRYCGPGIRRAQRW